MNPKPRMAKAHSKQVAEEYLRLGWTLEKEFYTEGVEEPYEYLLTWKGTEEPAQVDWENFPSKGNT